MLKISSHVRWVILNRRVVILCLRTGKYLGLNEVGTLIWGGLSEGLCRADICTKITQLYNVSIESAHADYDELLGGFCDRLLVGQDSARLYQRHPPRPFLRFPIPLAMNAWLCQVSVSLRLSLRGFSSAYDFATSCVDRMPDFQVSQLDQCLNSFVHAENFSARSISQQDCLPRSLSLFVYLVGCGYAVRHIIGVSDDPLRAHGWVELDNTILIDSKERVEQFVPISCLN